MTQVRCTTTRRRFLRQVGAGAAALSLPSIIPARVLGRPAPSDRVAIGLIGTGIRGKYLIGNLPPDGRMVALCDCYAPRMAFALSSENSSEYAAPLARFRQTDAASCATYQDYRQMIDRAKLDAVMIAVPDHHHVLAAMLALQAGLDVYLEKPLSLTIREGRALVEAVRRTGRVLQVGSQQRTMEMNRYACGLVRNGALGKVRLVQVPNYPGPMRYTGLPEEPVPEGLAWELFCGPTPLRPHNRKLWVKDEFKVDGVLWRGWDLFRSYSGHLMTNWGAHSLDMVQLALGKDDTGPVEVEPLTRGYSGPMRLCPVAMRYADGTELRLEFSLPGRNLWLFHGEQGRLSMRRNWFKVEPTELAADPPDPSVLEKWKGPGHVARPHIANWLECIKTRGRPNAPVEAGHRSVTLCHLANIAREVRRTLRWDPRREVFVGDDQANQLLDRPRRRGFELPQSG